MAKKILNFFKNLIWICIILIVIIGIIYIGCKYIIKDETVIENIQIIAENFGKYILGNQEDVYIELKDENFKNEVERAKYYYYIQLDENAKTIYMCLEKNIDNFRANKEEIKLPTRLNKIMESENGQIILQQAFQDAWDAFSKDKPELFYLDGNKFCLVTKSINTVLSTKYELSIGRGQNQNYYADGFNSEEQVNLAIQKFKNTQNEIIKSIPIENSEYTYSYEKILYVHDWIVDNASYDSEMKMKNNGNAYGILIDKKAVCEGYAEAFKCLMDELEVPCITVCGIGKETSTNNEEKHAWNYVYIGGKWYAVDATWDDPIINIIGGNNLKPTNRFKYKYFLKGSNTMEKDHIVTGEIIENGKKFEYPKLSSEDFNK